MLILNLQKKSGANNRVYYHLIKILLMQKNIVRISLLLLIILSLGSCKSSKSQSDSKNTETEKEMLSNGFHKGTIVDYSAEKGCTFLIKREETGELLLPLKLEDKFTHDNLIVWFKYEYSRRQQGTCLKGITITLGEILIRK